MLRAQVAAGQQFREQVETFWDVCVCEHGADAELAAREASTGEAEREGSRRALQGKSRKKSRHGSGLAALRNWTSRPSRWRRWQGLAPGVPDRVGPARRRCVLPRRFRCV